MDCYELWADIRPGVKDLDFVDALHAFLGHLKSEGKVHAYRIRRRKFGFSPDALCEFSISIEFENLTQMDEAFLSTATRAPEIEALHSAVFSKVATLKTALYRDFPDSVRVGG